MEALDCLERACPEQHSVAFTEQLGCRLVSCQGLKQRERDSEGGGRPAGKLDGEAVTKLNANTLSSEFDVERGEALE